MSEALPPSSLFRKVGLASLIMMASVFLSRVIGLVREMVIAWAGGAGAGVDAYQIAFVLPEILNHIVASGFLSVTFIPMFSRYLAQNREDEGWRVFSVIFTGFGSLMALLILLGVWFAPALVALLAPGIRDQTVMAEAVRMTRIILPAQFFFFAGGMLTAVQFAKEKFAVPALAPLIYNMGIIMGGVFLFRVCGMAGFSWGVLGGAFAGNFLLQVRGARRCGMVFQLRFDFRHPELRRYIGLTLPLMLGLTMTFSTEVFFKLFGSFLPEGSISALNYSLRVMLMLVGFFGQAVGVASYPFLARLAAENRFREMNRLLNAALRYLSLVIPASALMMALRHEIVRVLFERGRFDAVDAAMTANALLAILTGAFAFAAQTVVVRGFFALQDTLFPAIFGTLAALFSIPLYYIGMKEMGISGIALAVGLSALLQVSLLYGLWNRKAQNTGGLEVYGAILKMTIISIPLGLFLEAARRLFLDLLPRAGLPAQSLAASLLTCMVIGILFTAGLGIAGYGLNISEITWFINRIRKRSGPV